MITMTKAACLDVAAFLVHEGDVLFGGALLLDDDAIGIELRTP